MRPSSPAAAYLLVEPPGVIRAATDGGHDVRPGERVSDVLETTWDALALVARTAASAETPRGRFRVHPLHDGGDHVVAMLLEALPGYQRASSRPPQSSTRVALSLAAVTGKDPAARAAIDLAMRLAKTMLPIYICGEEGSGAEVVATAVVDAGGRSEGPFVRARAGSPGVEARPEWLFGIAAERCHGGILYIEDVEELDADTGRRLARELDKGVLADVHFIGTGVSDLRERVAERSFSRELFLLVRSSTVTLPALRDRDDFELVVRQMLADIDAAHGRAGEKRERYEVTREAMKKLRSHDWPGNLRELLGWLERAVASAAPDRVLREVHLPAEVDEPRAAESERRSHGLRRDAERAALEEALRASAGNVSLAAKKLGVARSTLYRMKQRYNIGS